MGAPAGLGAAIVSFMAALGITLAPAAQTELKIGVDAIVGVVVAIYGVLAHRRGKHALEVNAALAAKHLTVQQKQAEATIASAQAFQVAAAAAPDAGPPEGLPITITSDPTQTPV